MTALMAPKRRVRARARRPRAEGTAFALAAAPRDAGRRRSLLPLVSVCLTVVVALASSSMSARVASERREAARLAAGNAALAAEIATLSDELRVRMRLPQLQRWNDDVLRMQPASARQILASPAQLALWARDDPPPPAPLLVADAEPRLPAVPRPESGAAPQPAPPDLLPAPPARELAPDVIRAAPRPGLVLASVEQVIEEALADAGAEGSVLEPPVAPAPPVLKPFALPDLQGGP